MIECIKSKYCAGATFISEVNGVREREREKKKVVIRSQITLKQYHGCSVSCVMFQLGEYKKKFQKVISS